MSSKTVDVAMCFTFSDPSDLSNPCIYYSSVDPDELVRKTWTTQKEPPNTLLMPLLPYQKEGLGWMYNQEQISVHGGILADEMGMGKTIQAIALILDNRPDAKDKAQQAEWDASDVRHGADSNKLSRTSTLVVVPTIALRQWQMEISRFTAEGALTVKIYHGTTRSSSVKDLQAADVVLTTYAIMEAEYRKATAGAKVTCRLCDKKFYPDKLRVHRKYFCGTGKLTKAQAKTQRKRPRVTASAQRGPDVEDEDSEEDEEEDEVDRQKKMIKAKAAAATAAAAKKGKGKGGKGKKKEESEEEDEDEDCEEDEEEDEVDRQKKMIKAKAAAATAAAAKKGKWKGGKGKKKEESEEEDDEEEEEDSEEEEDEVDRQKKMIKAKAAAAAQKSSKKTPAKKGKSKGKDKGEGKGKGKKKVESISDDSSDSDWEDDEEEDNDEKDSDDDDDDDSEGDDDFTPKSAAKIRAAKEKRSSLKKGKTKGEKKKVAKGQKKRARDDSDELTSVKSEDSEVERDIAQALKAASKVKRPPSILHQVSWFRVILDEAHMIKDRSTSTAKAVFNLVSLNKLCLTGTPLQNRVGELYSLVRFLRLDPHAFYYCKGKGCGCKSLHYRFSRGVCDECGHSAMQHFCHFNKHILNPIIRSGYVGEGRKAMLRLKNEVLDEILLRRTKLTRADDIQLPTRVVKVRRERLDEKEVR